ncbi:MAG: DUF3179 domain-containing (seleno)protein, partial [Actinomycetota bacterium]|nr:DUF3179 domain-containing (seleno)protein [Actinomycetota bacterium]
MAISVVLLTGCADSQTDSSFTSSASTSSPVTAAEPFGPPPDAPIGDNAEATVHFEALIVHVGAGGQIGEGLTGFLEVADARHAWLLSDLLRFAGTDFAALLDGFAQLTGVEIGDIPEGSSPWNAATNRLIAWDLPAPPDYRELKGALYALVDERWAPFFDDADATIDWRWLSWGGVLIDDRPLGATQPCARGCIPSLDDPVLVSAAEGDWYDDESIVFGVTEGDEAVAFPKNMMQVHEMVNITIGGRRFGIPYCTLCGSAQAFYTDAVPAGVERPVLRTSGLLSRSNKVMYDLVTRSAFDTFTGTAVSGPLLDAGVVLQQNSVTISTWGEWKAAHPDTSIVAQDGGIGRTYGDDPLGGRDDEGPIFPIGDIDFRLGVQAPVVGVVLPDGRPIAFDRAAVDAATDAGGPIEFEGVALAADGGGY